ncbi:UNVERIFIED_CONTAM: hypothetical protein PYX00_001163 [Menopon gallinae]|uniref:Uncharacterized protein n=1 Tax=Menopon gallinae TaxID=328185 RepID=A0AAW2IBB4_9NEOP
MISMRCYLILVALSLIGITTVDCGIGLSPWQFFIGDRAELEKVIPIVFQPDEGMKLRKKFEKKYGVRGEKLVSSFGEGLELDTYQLPS